MTRQSTRPVHVTVYRITGRQGPIEIPHRYCEECDLTIRAVQRVIADLDGPRVTLTIRPWLLWFWRPLVRGGWHAPIVTVDGRVVSQGVVPSPETVRRAISAAWAARGTRQDARDADERIGVT